MKKIWTDHLSEDVYRRLCACRTIRRDLPELVNACWVGYLEDGKAARGFTKEDALVTVLELLECNSIFFDLSREEYDELCR